MPLIPIPTGSEETPPTETQTPPTTSEIEQGQGQGQDQQQTLVRQNAIITATTETQPQTPPTNSQESIPETILEESSPPEPEPELEQTLSTAATEIASPNNSQTPQTGSGIRLSGFSQSFHD